jgi:hypothetical protein
MEDLAVKVEAARSDYESSVCSHAGEIDQMEAKFRAMLSEARLRAAEPPILAQPDAELRHQEFRGWKPEYEAAFDGRCDRGGGGGSSSLEEFREAVNQTREDLSRAVEAEREACAWKAEWEQHKLQQKTLAGEVQEINRFLDNVNADTPTFCKRTYPNYAALCTTLASMTAQDLIDGWSDGCCDPRQC